MSFFSKGQQTSDTENDTTTTSESATYDSIATDFTKKIIANSRDQKLDGKNKTSVLIENVVIKQGSLEVNADRVEVDASRGNGNEVITATGSPATYQQRLEDGSMVTAEANLITYDVATRTIELVGEANITQNQSMVSADAISYNMLEQKISANSDENSDQQVNTVISFGEPNDNVQDEEEHNSNFEKQDNNQP
ncbi:MAG: lipopolysaccharide transport periplasmic protein LptA [Pseudomonadota bacterium]